MRSRRAFLATVAAGLLTAPSIAVAQAPGKLYRIGFWWDSPTVWPNALETFRHGLRDLGWVEGRTVTSIYTGAARRAPQRSPSSSPANATGLTIIMSEPTAKSVEVLKEALPGLASVAVLWDPATPSHGPALKAAETDPALDTRARLSDHRVSR